MWITDNKCRINKTISNKRVSFNWRCKKTSIRNPCAHKVVERSKRYYIYDWNRDPINKATLRITNHKIFASVSRSSLLYKVRLQFWPTDALKPKKLKVKGTFLSMCSKTHSDPKNIGYTSLGGPLSVLCTNTVGKNQNNILQRKEVSMQSMF